VTNSCPLQGSPVVCFEWEKHDDVVMILFFDRFETRWPLVAFERADVRMALKKQRQHVTPGHQWLTLKLAFLRQFPTSLVMSTPELKCWRCFLSAVWRQLVRSNPTNSHLVWNHQKTKSTSRNITNHRRETHKPTASVISCPSDSSCQSVRPWRLTCRQTCTKD